MSRKVVSIIVFLALSLGLSWLIALPLWLGDGLASRFFIVVALAVMATPAIAALVVVFFVEQHSAKGVRRRALGLGSVRPRSSWPPCLWGPRSVFTRPTS